MLPKYKLQLIEKLTKQKYIKSYKGYYNEVSMKRP